MGKCYENTKDLCAVFVLMISTVLTTVGGIGMMTLTALRGALLQLMACSADVTMSASQRVLDTDKDTSLTLRNELSGSQRRSRKKHRSRNKPCYAHRDQYERDYGSRYRHPEPPPPILYIPLPQSEWSPPPSPPQPQWSDRPRSLSQCYDPSTDMFDKPRPYSGCPGARPQLDREWLEGYGGRPQSEPKPAQPQRTPARKQKVKLQEDPYDWPKSPPAKLYPPKSSTSLESTTEPTTEPTSEPPSSLDDMDKKQTPHPKKKPKKKCCRKKKKPKNTQKGPQKESHKEPQKGSDKSSEKGSDKDDRKKKKGCKKKKKRKKPPPKEDIP